MKKQNGLPISGGKSLTRQELRKINGGYCNPGPYYNQPCTNQYQCGGPSCYTTLYCYIAPKASVGVCLFR
jgi:hypothetical protein